VDAHGRRAKLVRTAGGGNARTGHRPGQEEAGPFVGGTCFPRGGLQSGTDRAPGRGDRVPGRGDRVD
jgi:hypothetical protein